MLSLKFPDDRSQEKFHECSLGLSALLPPHLDEVLRGVGLAEAEWGDLAICWREAAAWGQSRGSGWDAGGASKCHYILERPWPGRQGSSEASVEWLLQAQNWDIRTPALWGRSRAYSPDTSPLSILPSLEDCVMAVTFRAAICQAPIV